MLRPSELILYPVTVARRRLSAVFDQPERTLLLGAILVLSSISAVTGAVLAGYFSVDMFSSLLFPPQDCWLNWDTRIGRHCFSDYPNVVDMGLRPNPWEPYELRLPWYNYQQSNGSGYPAAAMLPQLLFGLIGKWLNAPRLGLFTYLLVLASAVFSPAMWAARGARGLQRVVVSVALGAAAIPAWTVIDKGNSVGFIVPIALVFLVGLFRQRWGLVTAMVILAACVKPQFAVLCIALLAARQWRWGGVAIAGTLTANLAAYLIWPRDFPKTIILSIHNVLGYGGSIGDLIGPYNVSFQRGIFLIPDMVSLTMRSGSAAGARSIIGYVVLISIVVCVLALGRRIDSVMVGVLLLTAAALFPALEYKTYLVFALPIAALVARNPNGPADTGIFDQSVANGDPRRIVGVSICIAAALSIAPIALPGTTIAMPIAAQLGALGVMGTTPIVFTTAWLVPLAWLSACGVIVLSYMRRPVSAALGVSLHGAGAERTPIPAAGVVGPKTSPIEA